MEQSLRLRVYRVSYWCVIVGVALIIGQGYLAGLDWNEPRVTLEQMMMGTAHRPFVYRVLVPILVRWAVQIYPAPPVLYASVLIQAAFVGFAVAFRSLAARFWQSERALDFAGLASILLLFPLMQNYRHVYDFTELFLFTLALSLMAGRVWRWYLPIYALACLNKETAVLLAVVFALNGLPVVRSRRFWGLLGLQALIFALIRGVVTWRFAGNPGIAMEYHWPDQVAALSDAPVLVVVYMLYAAMIVALALHDSGRKPRFLQWAAVGVTPILLVTFWAWAYPFEIRSFYSAYPIYLLLNLPTLGRILRIPFGACTDVAPGLALEVSSRSARDTVTTGRP